MLVTQLQTPLLCAKHATNLMKKGAGVGGSIVFLVESTHRRSAPTMPGNVDALSALTVSAAAAGASDGIRVNCVSHAVEGGVGGVGGKASGEVERSLIFPLAVGREPTADDVAMQVAHLLSNKTAFMTGQTISADSGRSIM